MNIKYKYYQKGKKEKMQVRGRLLESHKNYETGKRTITFEIVDEGISEDVLENLHRAIDLDISAQKHSEKRSLDANAYFHSIVSLIAQKTGKTNTRTKNDLLAEYGFPLYIDGRIPCLSVKSAYVDKILENKDTHYAICGPDESHEGYTKLYVIRNSSTYTQTEFKKLLDGAIHEAEELGIDIYKNQKES